MPTITVVQRPVNCVFTCEKCLKEVAEEFEEFSGTYGPCCYWDQHVIECPHCGFQNEIDGYTLD